MLTKEPCLSRPGEPQPGLRGRGGGVVGGQASPLLFDFPLLSFLPSRHLISTEKSLLSLPFSVLGKGDRKIPTRWWPVTCEGPRGLQTPSSAARSSSDQPPAWGCRTLKGWAEHPGRGGGRGQACSAEGPRPERQQGVPWGLSLRHTDRHLPDSIPGDSGLLGDLNVLEKQAKRTQRSCLWSQSQLPECRAATVGLCRHAQGCVI